MPFWMEVMAVDRLEGRCWLDWWANPSTLLGSVEVAVVITACGPGWTADGRLRDDEDRDGFAFLCELDPVFQLRFEDESSVAVIVDPSDDHHRFALTEYTGPVHRSVEHHVDITGDPDVAKRPRLRLMGRSPWMLRVAVVAALAGVRGLLLGRRGTPAKLMDAQMTGR